MIYNFRSFMEFPSKFAYQITCKVLDVTIRNHLVEFLDMIFFTREQHGFNSTTNLLEPLEDWTC